MITVTVYEKRTERIIKRAIFDDYVAATKKLYEYKELYPKAKVELQVIPKGLIDK